MNISIFNLNCWLFPSPLSTDCLKRLSTIVSMIEAQNPEIVTLQEVWSNKYIFYLKKRLPQYFFISSETLFYNQSGLVTLLKQKPLHHRIKFFKLSFRHNLTEIFFHKGYITANIEINGEKWTIVNTHLYAAFSKKTEIITREQFDNIILTAQETSVILSGDLNLTEEKFNQINQEKFSRLCDSQITLGDPNNPYAYKRFNKFMVKNKKIDYMLYYYNKALNSKYEIVKTPFVSDHYPMFCKINNPL
ncbi:MAG: endonuclease/exonuclease/phosphatase family protein [Minisyncoccia bacterium]